MSTKRKIKDDSILGTCKSFIMVPISADGKFTTPLNKQINKRYPNVLKRIRALKRTHMLGKIGAVHKVVTYDSNKMMQSFILMVTTNVVGEDSRPLYVTRCMEKFMKRYRNFIIPSMTIPYKHFKMFSGDPKKNKAYFDPYIKDIIIPVEYTDL